MNHPHIMLTAMTPFPYTIEVASSLSQAKMMMHQHDIRHLPVVDDGRFVGLISDRDVKLTMAVCKEEQADVLKVEDVCIFDPFVVDTGAALAEVASHMAESHIGSAMVVKDGKLVGIFTSTDACRVLSEFAAEFGAQDYPDESA